MPCAVQPLCPASFPAPRSPAHGPVRGSADRQPRATSFCIKPFYAYRAPRLVRYDCGADVCPVQPAAAEDVQAGRYAGPFGNGGPGSGGPWGGGGGGGSRRRGPNIAGVRRYDTMDAPPMGGGG